MPTPRANNRSKPDAQGATQPSISQPAIHRPRIFVHTTFPAPYRVSVFDGLKSCFDVFVAYEDARDVAHPRNDEWYSRHLGPNAVIASSRGGASVYRSAVRRIQSFDAVLLYEYSTTPALRLMLRCLMKRVPYLINVDGGFVNRNPVKTVVKRFFIRRASACLAGSDSADTYLRKYGARPAQIFRHKFTNLEEQDVRKAIPSPLEKETIRRRLGLPVEATIFLAIGQFIHRKGFDILLQAWRHLDPRATLVIMGGGPEENLYQAIIEEHHLKNVLIRGFGPKKTVFDHYLASDCFVLPTREDVWGLVINEAMACGLPVVTTTRCVAGLELIVPRVNGIIVDVEDREALAKAMDELATNRSLRSAMAVANLSKIADYTIDSVVQSHGEALHYVLAR